MKLRLFLAAALAAAAAGCSRSPTLPQPASSAAARATVADLLPDSTDTTARTGGTVGSGY